MHWAVAGGALCRVAVFDDGLDAMRVHPNLWRIVATWKGKVRLENVAVGVQIQSISAWKVERVSV